MPRQRVQRSTHTDTKPTKRTVRTADAAQQALALHKKHQGKLEVRGRVRLSKDNLGLLYTPGVGAVSRHLAAHPTDAREYTLQGRTVAVISDGSAVLGLGNVGPEAALPVMEGKALLFKELAGIDAVPIVLSTQDPDEIVAAVKAIAPSFAGINLEDIAAPACFEVERRLIEHLTVPVMHDDQHGTAVAVLAALVNAHAVVKKNMTRSRIAIIGAGAAGIATARLLLYVGVGDVILVDRNGILSRMRTDLSPPKEDMAQRTNREQRFGGVLEALAGADAVVGLSRPNAITQAQVRMMAQRPIVFALANPEPELPPDEARAAGAAVVATGRSDFPNQVNNVLVFPGMFKGALEHGVTRFTDAMKVNAALALARTVPRPTAQKILPSVFNKRVVRAIARAIC